MISFFVIVPTRNSYHLLPDLVKSLQSQTYPYWRVKFIDGHSNADHCSYLNKICKEDSRLSWNSQLSSDSGIFGAMNEGLYYADLSKDWILFWGSDDQASSPFVLEQMAERLENYIQTNNKPDLFVCRGVYYQVTTSSFSSEHKSLGRKTHFNFSHSYRRSLFWGSTPPHQATLFGSGALKLVPYFSTTYKLSADLDYFLRLSRHPSLNVIVDDQDIVLIGDAGVSNQQTISRLSEVIRAYMNAFGNWWWISFISRYIQRFQTVLHTL
jgi:glycosyltransferase involved in cell wall biosynthesis